jgi:hypothetical protein
MIKNQTVTTTPSATPVRVSCDRMPALLPQGSGTGVSFEGRLMVADIAYTAVRVPAFKDAPGVRAWSPPV